MMKLHGFVPEIMRQACNAVRALSVRRIKNKLHLGNNRRLVDAGALEAVVAICTEHVGNEYVSAACASAIGGFAKDDSNRDRLGKLGAADALMNVLKLHNDCVSVISDVALAIDDMAFQHDENMSSFSTDENDATLLLLRALAHHESSALVAASTLQVGTFSSDLHMKIFTCHKSNFLLIYMCKLHWNLLSTPFRLWFVCRKSIGT